MRKSDVEIVRVENVRLTRENRKLRKRVEKLESENRILRTADTLSGTLHESVRKAMKKVGK